MSVRVGIGKLNVNSYACHELIAILLSDDIDHLGGTAGYFAPEWFSEHEQVAGSDLTFKVDVWGLAVTMCEFVCALVDVVALMCHILIFCIICVH